MKYKTDETFFLMPYVDTVVEYLYFVIADKYRYWCVKWNAKAEPPKGLWNRQYNNEIN